MKSYVRTPMPALILVMALLVGCAHSTEVPTAPSPSPKPTTSEATSSTATNEATSTAVMPGDHIAARSYIDAKRGWAVGTDRERGSLVLHTADAGKHWRVLLRDDHGFPLVGVSFVDALHGWAVSSSGTLVGFIIATTDGGRTWVEQGGAGPLESVEFTDNLHGVVRGLDGDSPQRPITLETIDGGTHWKVRR